MVVNGENLEIRRREMKTLEYVECSLNIISDFM
jgi:hypothetical protein